MKNPVNKKARPPKWPIWDILWQQANLLHNEIWKEAHNARGILLDIGGAETKLHNVFKPYIKKYFCINLKKCSNSADANINGSALLLPIKNNSIDTIICNQVIEHLPNPSELIDEIYRVLKPDGYCIISTNMAWIYHPDPEDYYRFTKAGLKYLLGKFSTIEVKILGGFVSSITQFIVLPFQNVPLIGPIVITILNFIGYYLDKIFFEPRLSTLLIAFVKK